MNLAGGDKRVHPRLLGVPHRLPCRIDILLVASRQAADHRNVAVLRHRLVPDLHGDGPHRIEVVGGGRGEAGLDDVNAEAGELAGNDELLFACHGGAGGLLPVAEGGVEDPDVAGVGDVVGVVLRAGLERASGGSRTTPWLGEKNGGGARKMRD